MKTELIKVIFLAWMVGMAYMVYIMLADVQYLTKLIHAYITMAMEIIG
tara:strand:- start:243 stop:386 length:144 start_codon:yes stop_codon:yes gene_type:complete